MIPDAFAEAPPFHTPHVQAELISPLLMISCLLWPWFRDKFIVLCFPTDCMASADLLGLLKEN